MKKSKFWPFILGLFLFGLIIYFSYSIVNWKYYSKKTKSMPTPTSSLVTPTEDHIARDYVCGKLVDKTSEFKEKYLGYDFYFCSKDCKDKFLKEPLKYIPLRIRIKIKPTTPIESPVELQSPTPEKTPLPEITLEDLDKVPPTTTPTVTPTEEQNYPEDTIEVIPEGEDTPTQTKTVETQEDL